MAARYGTNVGVNRQYARDDIGMAPYALTGQGGFAVESCINMLIELCNNKSYNTSDFTNQSRLNVFFPLGLEGENATQLLNRAGTIPIAEAQNSMFGLGNLMGNYPNINAPQGTPAAAPAEVIAFGNTPAVGSRLENILRQIQVPGSITGATRTQNAAVMEHQRMILTQRDLLGRLGQWIETGEGILAYGGVNFSAESRRWQGIFRQCMEHRRE